MEKTTFEIKKSTIWKGLAGMLAVVALFMFFSGNLGFSENRGIAPVGNAVVVLDNGIVEVRTLLQNFQYNPDVITVKEGSKVRLIIDNRDSVNHGLHLPQFGVVRGLQPNAINTIEFTAIDSPTNGQAVPTCSQEHGETLTFNVV